jgi:hypothetical protein
MSKDLIDHHCFGDIFKLVHAELTHSEEPGNTPRCLGTNEHCALLTQGSNTGRDIRDRA